MKKKQTFIFIYHIIFMVMTWIYVLRTIIPYTVTDGFNMFIQRITQFTVQSNIMVALWFTYAVIFFLKNNGIRKEIRYSYLTKGAISTYITITMLVYAFFLAPYIDFQGETLIMIQHWYSHFILPPIFIIDFFLINVDRHGKWYYPIIWMIYPLLYLIYTLILGFQTDYFPYYFLDPTKMGSRYYVSLIMLFLVFVGIGYVFLYIRNLKYRLTLKRLNEKNIDSN